MSTPYTQRVQVGAYYTDGIRLWEVVEVNPLGTVELFNAEEPRTAGTTVQKFMGISAFRRQMWLARSAQSGRE